MAEIKTTSVTMRQSPKVQHLQSSGTVELLVVVLGSGSSSRIIGQCAAHVLTSQSHLRLSDWAMAVLARSRKP